MIRISAKTLTPGTASGSLALLSAPLSLWGGLDLGNGTIRDLNHPQYGIDLAGRVLAMKSARGSSSSSSALVEAARRGSAPAAILLGKVDPILVIGSLVAADLYNVTIPILQVEEEDWPRLVADAAIIVQAEPGQAVICI